MASLLRVAARSRSLVLGKPLGACAVVRNYWNEDWKPGPYPKTAEERAAAAKKYGMLPEDYEPYPDDGMGYGDYPKLPVVSGTARSFHENLDMEALKRNYMEPVHAHYELYVEERLNPVKEKFSGTQKFALFSGVMGAILISFLIGDMYLNEQPVLPKQYPKEGVVHYTFDPAE